MEFFCGHQIGCARGAAADLCKMFLLRCGVQHLDPGTLKKIAQMSTAPIASGDDVLGIAPTNALMQVDFNSCEDSLR